jgi:hypothetical protein
MTDATSDDDAPLLQELLRVMGDGQDEAFFRLLPLVDEADALAFFRTVPSGATVDVIQRLATEYRAAHPLPGSGQG